MRPPIIALDAVDHFAWVVGEESQIPQLPDRLVKVKSIHRGTEVVTQGYWVRFANGLDAFVPMSAVRAAWYQNDNTQAQQDQDFGDGR